MIVRITGVLADVEEEAVVIEHDGIAREVLVPAYAVAELAAFRGRQVTLHTIELLEGNAAMGSLTPRLIGFRNVVEKAFYRRFVEVKGIGPRKALRALVEPIATIARWIEDGDSKSLKRLPGIGARAADLIVAQLKGKMEDLALPSSSSSPEPTLTTKQRDALEVLLAWGDGRPESQRWLDRAAQLHPDIQSVDEWVRAAYRIKTGVEG